MGLPVLNMTMNSARLSSELHQALRGLGFVYLTNHGVDLELMKSAFDVSVAFFRLPDEEKQELHIKKSGLAMHGFTPKGGENVGAYSDHKETFDSGRHRAGAQQTIPFTGPTPWPPSLPIFEEVMTAYHAALYSLAHRVMALIAISIDLPPEHFSSYLQEPISILRALHYPVQEGTGLGVAPHTDYGCLTLLAQDSVGGLQVRGPDNADGMSCWVDVVPMDGALVVNVGDMLEVLTNGLYKATEHRVLSSPRRERYSLAFFFDFDFSTEVSPLSHLLQSTNGDEYGVVVSGEHKIRRYQQALQIHDNTSPSHCDG